MKRGLRIFAIAAWVGLAAFVALYSAMGFFDVLWRGSVLFEGIVGYLVLAPVVYGARRVLR